MADTTPKMSLRRWDQLSDPFSHDQLGDNWLKIDFHDHTPGRGVQIPTEGLADGAVTPTKASSALDPSPSFTSWKTLRTVGGFVVAGNIAGTYVLNESNPSGITSSATYGGSGTATYFDPADYAVTGRTLKLRVNVGIVVSSGAAPATNFQVGLLTINGWASGFPTGLSLQTSTTFTTPALSTVAQAATPEITAPTAGWYEIGVITSATAAVSSSTLIRAQLQYRQL